MKIVYIMKDPFGRPDLKIGKTGDPEARLGNYQNSFSSKSHIAQFDYAWYGDNMAVDNLEKAIKQTHHWDIELDGRGHSEWIYDKSLEDMISSIEEIIKDYKFKVQKVDNNHLPLNRLNLEEFLSTLDHTV